MELTSSGRNPMAQSALTKKQTLIPLVLALLIPAGLVVLLFSNNRSQPIVITHSPTVIEKAPSEMAYFQIKVLDTEGQTVANRGVTFRHEEANREDPGAIILLAEVQKQTDSAGIATISLEKLGHVAVQIQGRDKQEKFKDLELASSTLYELTIILDESEMSLNE
jgi:hypothetical protein